MGVKDDCMCVIEDCMGKTCFHVCNGCSKFTLILDSWSLVISLYLDFLDNVH